MIRLREMTAGMSVVAIALWWLVYVLVLALGLMAAALELV